MNVLSKLITKKSFLTLGLLMGLLFVSCGTYKGTESEDGIYAQHRTVTEKEEVAVVDKTPSKQENYFAKELERYENIDDEAEIFTDEDSYSQDGDSEETYTESNAAWGYDTQDVDVTYHVAYDFYHPYHNFGYYGYNWGYYHYPSYYYRPYWGYYNYGYNYYDPFYDPYYSGFYSAYYSPYYYNYGYYNPGYYGGYGYSPIHYTPRYINRYGRRANYIAHSGRRSLSSSVARSNASKRSIIRGSKFNVDRTRRTSVRSKRDANQNLRRKNTTPTSRDYNKPQVRRTNTRVRKNTTTNPNRENSKRYTTPTRRNNSSSGKTTRSRSYSSPSRSSNSSGYNRSSSSRSSGNSSSSSSRSSSSSSRSSSSSSRSSSGRGRR